MVAVPHELAGRRSARVVPLRLRASKRCRYSMQATCPSHERSFRSRRPPGRFGDARVIVTGVSNGAGAALQAAGLDADGRVDDVVALAPNVHVDGGRPLYDVVSEAAQLLPCALTHPRCDATPFARIDGTSPPGAAQAHETHEERAARGEPACSLLPAQRPMRRDRHCVTFPHERCRHPNSASVKNRAARVHRKTPDPCRGAAPRR